MHVVLSSFRNRTNKSRGGVAIYIRKNIEYKLREDLDIFVEGEFESIFLETVINNNKTVIGEIYRVPNSNINQSIERYDEIFSKTKDAKNVIIGTDQNFDLLKIESHKQTADLLNTRCMNSTLSCRLTYRIPLSERADSLSTGAKMAESTSTPQSSANQSMITPTYM